jgi:hypothetical protein
MPILFVKFSDLPAFRRVNRNEYPNDVHLSRKFSARYSGKGAFWSILPGAPLAPFARWLVIHPAPHSLALNYPSSSFSEITALGARWDKAKKALCIHKGMCMYTFLAWLPTQREKNEAASSKVTHDAMLAHNAAMWGGGWESGDEGEEEEEEEGASFDSGEKVWLNPGWDAAVAAAQNGSAVPPSPSFPGHTPLSVRGGGCISTPCTEKI